MKTIALTMRIQQAEGYTEARSAIAQDWLAFLAQFPIRTLLVPNWGKSVNQYLEEWNPDAILLSGGNDIGQEPVRDETETGILTWSKTKSRPVLGVCRGLQLIQTYCGGGLESCDPHQHVNQKHKVILQENFGGFRKGDSPLVNSFHSQTIKTLAPDLVPLARDEEGRIEAARHRSLPWLGVMWHPEREPIGDSFSISLLREGLQI